MSVQLEESIERLQHPGEAPTTLAVTQLALTNFRSYPSLHLSLGTTPVVLTGANGAGKTNILEALSFFSPGRGLRGAKLTEIDYAGDKQTWQAPWGVASVWQTAQGGCQVGTGRLPAEGSALVAKRAVKIEGQVVRGQAELVNVCSVLWLTPAMDKLFLEGASERRRFLDRLVYNFDASHAGRVAKYEYLMRERIKLLLQPYKDRDWLNALEEKMAEAAVAVAAARLETVEVLQQRILKATTPFPKAWIAVDGAVEGWVKAMPALQAEEKYREVLLKNREMDAMTCRTQIGVHRSDFLATHAAKAMPAALCSTGEQKALLLSILLAEARAKAEWKGSVPVLLLDEVVAHLDHTRREALFAELLALRAQAWMTGTDRLLFEGFGGEVQYLEVKESNVISPSLSPLNML